MRIKAIIFDWGRTLFDSETKKEFPEAERILCECRNRGYQLAVASLVSQYSNADLQQRTLQINNSPLKQYFTITKVTDNNKDEILEEIVRELNIPRSEIMIVDDRTIRGISYGNKRGHITVWLQKGKFANELPNEETGPPTFIIHNLNELLKII